MDHKQSVFRWWIPNKVFKRRTGIAVFSGNKNSLWLFLTLWAPIRVIKGVRITVKSCLLAFLCIMEIKYHNTNFSSYASCPWSPPHPIHCHTLPPSIHPVPPPFHPNSPPWELLCRWHKWETCKRQPNVIISYETVNVWDSQKGISNPALHFLWFWSSLRVHKPCPPL